MSPSVVFCMDPVTLLQSAELPATQHIFEQNYVSCICFAPCQNFFFFPLMEPSLSAKEPESGLGNGELPRICRGQGMEMTQDSLSFPGCQLKSIFGWQQIKVYI